MRRRGGPGGRERRWFVGAGTAPRRGAVGDGPTRDAAIADLREALEVLLAEVGPPDELTLTLSVA